MRFPTPHPVVHIPFAGVAQDSLGNDVPSFGAPEAMKAIAFQPHRSEDTDGHTSRDEAEMDLAMPSMQVDLVDRFVVNGLLYEVVGTRDNDGGFHGWKPGVIVELKRVTG